MWVAEYLDEVDSDFRVFHRVDGVADGHYGGLSAERFFLLAERLPSYRGAVRQAALAEARKDDQPEQVGVKTGKAAGVDRDQFAKQSHGQATIPDRDLYEERLRLMGMR
jgi:hypothetical protein